MRPCATIPLTNVGLQVRRPPRCAMPKRLRHRFPQTRRRYTRRPGIGRMNPTVIKPCGSTADREICKQVQRCAGLAALGGCAKAGIAQSRPDSKSLAQSCAVLQTPALREPPKHARGKESLRCTSRGIAYNKRPAALKKTRAFCNAAMETFSLPFNTKKTGRETMRRLRISARLGEVAASLVLDSLSFVLYHLLNVLDIGT